jgi:hypothetical protein
MSARRFMLGFVSLWVSIGGLALVNGSALAAAPEEPETKPVREIRNTTATLEGVVNPKSQAVDSWYFQYDEGSSCAGGKTTAVRPEAGPREVEAEPTQATISGLQPSAQYTFCLVARNEAEEATVGKALSFTTTTVKPLIAEESSSNVGPTGATASAQINAEGMPTTYFVEYGKSEAYGFRTLETSAGAPEGPVGVLVQLSGLEADSVYHFRFVAISASGETDGKDVIFAAPAALGPSALVLPDKRVYELVSPPENPGEVYVIEGPRGATEDIQTFAPTRASVDGNAVVYAGDPPASGGSGSIARGGGDDFIASRGPDGWSASDIAPPQTNTLSEEGYQAFSNDLSTGIAVANDRKRPALTADAPEKCGRVLYAHNDYSGAGENSFSALFTKGGTSGKCGGPLFAGASADNSHLLFQDELSLAPGAEEAAGNGEEVCEEHCNLYASVAGQLATVNILPDGKMDPNAVFGGPSEEEAGNRFPPDFSNVISADGSHIVWTDMNTGLLYVREYGTRTVQLSAGAAQYWTTTPDGHYAFYTEDGNLWRFNVGRFDVSSEPESEAIDKARERLTGEGEGVQGVIGINETGEDGAYVYIVAEGALAPGAERRTCRTALTSSIEAREEYEAGKITEAEYLPLRDRLEVERNEELHDLLPVGRGCNIYLLHSGEPVRFVGAVSKNDDDDIRIRDIGGFHFGGDWQPDLGARTAEVTPDGRHLIFESKMSRSLTGYDNSVVAGSELGLELEVFVFDAGSGRVSCASCVPSGARSRQVSGVEVTNFTDLPVSGWGTFMRRWISEDGRRVFFETAQPLVPQDINGVKDVYEWEQEGSPSCPTKMLARLDRGCVFLLSGGGGSDASSLVDASGSGGDVFFTSRSRLTPTDRTEKMELFDARVDGGFAEIEHSCVGTGCQGVPPAPPIFATPSSVTFSGVGNFEPPPKAAVKPKRKAAKCRRGFVKKHGKCVKHAKKKAKKSSKHSRGGSR